MQQLGSTRSVHERDHILQTPDTFVYAPLPGMHRATAAVHVSPAAGADFVQYTAVFEEGGRLGAAVGSRFLYVLEGDLHLVIKGNNEVTLWPGSYAYLPPGTQHEVTSLSTVARVEVIEKSYVAGADLPAPRIVVGHEQDVVSTALGGDEELQVRMLLPADESYDFAVNTMEYQPGASLSMVEMHVMEHGLLMLEGGGIYRLGDKWYPVTKGDFIWMAPYCPQWFGALGKAPAKYLIYKDWNRHPLSARVEAAR